jgi:hypothetical protein
MELYNKKENSNLPNQNPGELNSKTEEAELHNEGIDLVGSGIREENEFTGDESTPPEAPATEPEPLKEEPKTEPPKAPVSVVPAPQKSEPLVSPAPKPAQNDPSIRPLRTFKTDAEEAVRYKNISAVDIAVAEQKRREATPGTYTSEKKPHAGIFIATVMILIVALGAGWYLWFNTSQGTETAPPIQGSIETIIPYAKGSTLLLDPDSDPLVLIGAKLATSNAGLGNVYALIPIPTSASAEQAPIASVFGKTNIPSRLERSLSSEYMIGTFTYDVQSPFIILKNTFFQNAFAGMLEWEKNLRSDLLPLIHVSFPQEIATTNSDTFEDIVISNIDTRILKNAEGKTILAYAFADTGTIVIATNETTLKYVLDRLLTVRSVQ